MEQRELDGIRRVAAALRKKTAPLLRLTDADVEHQRMNALLHNLSSAQEFLTPAPHSLAHCTDEHDHTARRLLPHQKDGVRWLCAMQSRGHNAIVADEMGLGKTVQTLAFFSALAAHGSFGTYLVVAPLTTLPNWEKEADAWVPWMHNTLFKGDSITRAKLRAKLRRRHRKAFAQAVYLREQWMRPSTDLSQRAATIGALLGGLVLTSYEMLMADKGALARLLPWDVVVVDEAQRLKRVDCRLLQQLQKADTGAMRILLTGTPVQNNARELWTLMEFIAPQVFTNSDTEAEANRTVHAVLDAWLLATGKKARKARSKGTKRARVEDAEEETEETEDTTDPNPTMDAIAGELRAALQPFVLRRTKVTAGLSLPPRVQVILPTPLSGLQRRVYEAVQKDDAFLNNRVMHLRRCCLYPGPLVDQLLHPNASPENGAGISKERRLIEKMVNSQLKKGTVYTALSSKLALLSEMLPTLHAAGHRVLLFSQFTSVLDVLEDYLSSQLPSLNYARLDGATTAEDRATSTAQFQATPPSNKQTGSSCLHRPFMGNVESGVVEDDLVFSTPPPLIKRAQTGDGRWSGSPLTLRPLNSQASTPTKSPAKEKREKAFLFLISTRTGGAGLNLTGADTVILFDGDFNPHNDRQAIDRCHRIGQRRPVAVYRLVCPGTVEAEQLAIARRKLLLEDAMLGGSGASEASLSRENNMETVYAACPLNADKGNRAVKLLPLEQCDFLYPPSDDRMPLSEGVIPLATPQLTLLLDRQWLLEQQPCCAI